MAANTSGGWIVDPKIKECKLPKKVAKAFKQALEGFTGAGYTPALYCGSQLVNGFNYMIICKQRLAIPDPIPNLAKVFVHAPIKGKATLLAIEPLDPFGLGR